MNVKHASSFFVFLLFLFLSSSNSYFPPSSISPSLFFVLFPSFSSSFLSTTPIIPVMSHFIPCTCHHTSHVSRLSHPSRTSWLVSMPQTTDPLLLLLFPLISCMMFFLCFTSVRNRMPMHWMLQCSSSLVSLEDVYWRPSWTSDGENNSSLFLSFAFFSIPSHLIGWISHVVIVPFRNRLGCVIPHPHNLQQYQPPSFMIPSHISHLKLNVK